MQISEFKLLIETAEETPCILVEDAMEWLGFRKKDTVKTKLITTFTEGKDFSIDNIIANGRKNTTALGGRPREIILISPGTFKMLLFANQRSAIAVNTCRLLGLEQNCKFNAQEAVVVHQIMTVFHSENMVTQFPIGSYRIDLYFPDRNIAVEFDEMHHATMTNLKADVFRQQFIESLLKCTFVRIKWNDDILFGLNQIFREIVRNTIE